jgi:SWIM/SEC-C metal-binding protein
MNPLENLGSTENPIRVLVHSDELADRVEDMCEMFEISAVVEIDEEAEDNLNELFLVLKEELKDLPWQDLLESPAPKPNNFCPCGSNKKYKKCCMPKDLSASA